MPVSRFRLSQHPMHPMAAVSLVRRLRDGLPWQSLPARKNLPAIAGRSGIKAFGGLRVVIDGKLVYPLEIVDSQIVARASTEIIPVNAGCARDDQIRFFIVSRFIYLIIVDNRNRNFSPVCMGFADLQVAVTDDLSFAGLLVWVSRVEIGRFFGRIDGVLP